MSIIEIEKLTKYYSHNRVVGVKNLSLKINQGEVFGFIGPNGAGKTTTIRLLLDLIRPTSGHAKIFGRDINTDSVEIREQIGFLPGEVFLPENLTGKACIDYYSGFKEKIDQSYLKTLIRRLNFDTSKKIRDYSKGNKQKLAVILALIHQPKLLILDEPTAGLDPINQQTFYDLLLATKKTGVTTFFSTHILAETEKICDRVGIIKDGQLLKIEDIDEFKEKNVRQIFVETKTTLPIAELTSLGVKKIEKVPGGYNLTTAGKIGQLISKISKHPIDDIKITEPSLEEIFFHYYKK